MVSAIKTPRGKWIKFAYRVGGEREREREREAKAKVGSDGINGW
jgi:hypothetical protein